MQDSIDDTIDLRKYAAAILDWWWLLAIAAVAAALAGYALSINAAPVYEASTLLMVGSGLDAVNPTSGELQTSERLAHTYAAILTTRPVLNATIDALRLPRGAFASDYPKVSVAPPNMTQLLRITVHDLSPERAAAVADELARQLILHSPGAEEEALPHTPFVEQQLATLQTEIESLSRAISHALDELHTDEATRLQVSLESLRGQYVDFLGLLQVRSTNLLKVVEPAIVPTRPVSPRVWRNAVLSAVAGAAFSVGVVLLIAFLDDSIRSRDDAEAAFELPVLGEICEFGGNPTGSLAGALVSDDLLSPQAEGFRMLHTNLRYSLPSSVQSRTFLVSSVMPGDGKSTVVANLGVVSALSGLKTLVVDADMRRPRQHEILGQCTSRGLSSLLVGEVAEIDHVLQATATEGLSVLPCGTVPPNPAELLGSSRMTEILAELTTKVDVIILDAPPLLSVADAGILASQVAGVIVVACAGRTKIGASRSAMETLRHVNGKPLGIVLNRVPRRGRAGYGSRYIYSYYADDERPARARRGLPSLFRRVPSK